MALKALAIKYLTTPTMYLVEDPGVLVESGFSVGSDLDPIKTRGPGSNVPVNYSKKVSIICILDKSFKFYFNLFYR